MNTNDITIVKNGATRQISSFFSKPVKSPEPETKPLFVEQKLSFVERKPSFADKANHPDTNALPKQTPRHKHVPDTEITNKQPNVPRVDKKNRQPKNMHSLTEIVSQMKNEIEKRGTASTTNLESVDSNNMRNFRNKFKTSYDSWNSLMDYILKTTKQIDDTYAIKDYLGLKDRILQTISNISLSLIILGENAVGGAGIDNLYEQVIISNDNNNVANKTTTVKTKIKAFLSTLLKQMEIISKTNETVSKLNDIQSNFLRQQGELSSKIETLKKTIKEQQKNTNIEEKEMIKVNLAQNQTNLNKYLSDFEENNKKIKTAISQKDRSRQIINDVLNQTFGIIDFSYFMHDDWCPSLDYRLLP